MYPKGSGAGLDWAGLGWMPRESTCENREGWLDVGKRGSWLALEMRVKGGICFIRYVMGRVVGLWGYLIFMLGTFLRLSSTRCSLYESRLPCYWRSS